MPRPKTKEELLNLSQANYKRLIDFIKNLDSSELEKDFPKGTMNRNIRDVLAHLHHWNQMTLGWYKVGMKGNKPDMPAKGYTWKTLPDLNKVIFETYQNTSLDEAKKMFNGSFKKLQKVINKHDDENLFTKKKYNWTGSTSLAAYLISATSSHYDWAYKLIKRAKK